MASQVELLQAILTELKTGSGNAPPRRTGRSAAATPSGTSPEDFQKAGAALAKEQADELKKLDEALEKAEKSYTRLEGVSSKYAKAQVEQARVLAERTHAIENDMLEQERSNATLEAGSEALAAGEEALRKYKEELAEVGEEAAGLNEKLGAEKGLASEVSRLGQSLTGTGLKAGGFGDKMSNLSKKFANVAGTSGDMKGAVASGLKSFGKSALLKPIDMLVNSTLGLIKAQDAAISAFRRGTGAGKEYNLQITALERATYDSGITAADAGKTYQALFTSMSSFTQLNKGEQRQIAKTTALLETQGVSSGTSAKIMDQMTRSLGKSAGDSNDVMLRLAGSAKSLGVPMGKLADDFAASFGELAKYGDGAIDVFEGLAVQAKKTGLEVGDLMKIAGQFDTFEDAASSVGKLNAIMGGPYLNSIDMLNASEEERIELLRNTVQASGMQFDAMNRFEKQAMASAMGVSVDEASRIMKMSTAEMELEAMKAEELEEQARNSQEMMEMLKNSFHALALDIRPFFEETIIPMIEGFAGMAKGFGEFLNKLGQFVKVGLLAAGIAALIAAPFTGGTSLLMYAAIAGLAAGGIAYAVGGPKTRGTAEKKEKEEDVDLEGFHMGGTVFGLNKQKTRAVRINEGGAGETAILPVGSYVASARDTGEMITGMAQLAAKTDETNRLLRALMEGANSGRQKVQLVLDNGKEFSTTVVKQGLSGDVVTPFGSGR